MPVPIVTNDQMFGGNAMLCPDYSLTMHHRDQAELLRTAAQARTVTALHRAERLQHWADRLERAAAYLSRLARIRLARL